MENGTRTHRAGSGQQWLAVSSMSVRWHDGAMESAAVEAWVTDYERLWRTAGTQGLTELFTPDASYLCSPWAPRVVGLSALAEFWEAQRDGPDELFTMSSEVVAIDGLTAVVRVNVEYGSGSGRWRDLWILRFDESGRCAAFEEWPFAPGQNDGHSPSGYE